MTQPPTPPPVPVAGLLVPAALVPRIIAALRATYPDLTMGLEPEAAVRAVLKHWVTITLAAHEAAAAEAPVQQVVEQVQGEYKIKANQAREKALTDANQIVDSGVAVDLPVGGEA